MKKSLLLLAAFVTFLAACDKLEDPLSEVYTEYETEKDPIVEAVEYTLTADDYATIADMVRANATTVEDSANADRVEDYMTFTPEITANKYVPYLLSDMYLALETGSSAMVTYNINAEMPDDLTMYTSADKYELKESDYTSFDGYLDATKFFTPSHNPDVFVASKLPTTGYSDGDLLLATYEYSTVDALVDFSTLGNVELLNEPFAASLGSFTATSVVGDQVWVQGSYSGTTYAKISGFSGSYLANEDWLISPALDMSKQEGEVLTFKTAMKYGTDGDGSLKTLVSTDYDGTSAPSSATWTELSPALSTGNYTWVASGDLDLSSYSGTLYVAFKYTSTTLSAATWEVAEVKVSYPSGATVIGGNPMEYSTFYMMDDGAWEKAANIYYINAADYDAMGEGPGKYNNFSFDYQPQDYIPTMLNAKFPVAGEGAEVVVVYKYYDSGTKTLADKYTKTGGMWNSYYNYIQPKTDQFINNGTNWVFDPTVAVSMGSADYGILVDWVKASQYSDKIDSYGTAEFHFGASAYYGNFDMREGKWNADVFGSADEAVTAALVVLLQAKYPDAVTQIEGVDVYYVVTYAYYNGANGKGSKKFQCTKSGPSPEFTFVEDL